MRFSRPRGWLAVTFSATRDDVTVHQPPVPLELSLTCATSTPLACT